tara:strand:- start:80 stop:838 length:759 start_codon:yes stop_codon:yes gene_type:complete
MINKDLVSIIITYYRKQKYLIRTLNSIKKQNYKKYEIIFVFDDYNKKELTFIKKLLKKFKRKKIINNNKNLGVSKSRNIAIKYCNGKYIAFIDADDIWLKNKLKYQISFMDKNSIMFSFSSYGVIDENNKILRYRKVNSNPSYNSLIKNNIIGLSTVVLHKKLKNKIKFKNLKTQEDFALWLKLLRLNITLYHIKKTLSYWRKTNESLSSNKFQKLRDAFKLFYKYENKNLLNAIYCVLILITNKILKTYKI